MLNKRGATLIETLVYLVVFVLLILAVIGLLLAIARAFYAGEMEREIVTAGVGTMEKMVRESRRAQDVDLVNSILDVHPGRLVFVVPDSGAEDLGWRGVNPESSGGGVLAKLKQLILKILAAVLPSHPIASPFGGPECGDTWDNDGDGLTDYPADPGCINPNDETETGACLDWWDNDTDGLTDYPADPGCTSADDNDETDPPPLRSPSSPDGGLECADVWDNDGDGLTDYPADPGCTSADDNDETDPPPPPPDGGDGGGGDGGDEGGDEGVTTTTSLFLDNGRLMTQTLLELPLPLSGARITVDNLVFHYFTTPVSKGVKIDLTLTARRGGVSRTENFYGTAILRGGY